MIYGLIAGLLFGSGVGGHALRILTTTDPTRLFIAYAAMVIYFGGGVFCLMPNPIAGLVIAVLFPIVGVTAVIVTGHKVDKFQIVLGIPQVVAAVLSVVALLG
jgi:hypothetical protein